MTSKLRGYLDRFSLELAAFYATLGIATGIGMPFFPVWLQYRGLSPGEIGIILAVPMVVRIFFVPLATRLADRLNALRGAILTASIGSAVGNAAIGVMDSFTTILLAIIGAAVFFTPTYPLVDAYALRGLADRGRAYGPVRLWSSAAFIAANVGSGFLIGVFTRASVIWFMTAAFVAGTIIAWLMAPVRLQGSAHQQIQAAGRSLWRLPAFVAIVVVCSFVQASHAVYYGFSTLAWNAKGLGDTVVGTLWGLGVLAEIVLFALSGRLPAFITPAVLVVIGGVGALVRWTAMAFDPPFALLPLLQCLHALSFGATHIGAMQFLAQVAPAGRAATAQGDFAAAQGAIFSAAMAGSGVLFHAYGDLAYIAMAVLAGAGVIVALGAGFVGRGQTRH